MGLGTAQFGDLFEEFDNDRAAEVVDAAWEAGIRYFDTAPFYGNGAAEERLGRAIAHLPRAEYVVSSKVGRLLVPVAGERTPEDGPVRAGREGLGWHWDFSASGIRRSIEGSLERLGLDRLDIVLIHDPAEHLTEALAEAYPELERMRDAGLVGAIGVGTGTLDALTSFARETDIDVMIVAGRYTLLEQPAARELMPICVEKGISILAAGVFNTGLLAERQPPAEARYEYRQAPQELIERARLLASICEEFGTTLPEAALAYAANGPAVAAVLVGSDTAAQITENARMLTEAPPLDQLFARLRSDGLVA